MYLEYLTYNNHDGTDKFRQRSTIMVPEYEIDDETDKERGNRFVALKLWISIGREMKCPRSARVCTETDRHGLNRELQVTTVRASGLWINFVAK